MQVHAQTNKMKKSLKKQNFKIIYLRNFKQSTRIGSIPLKGTISVDSHSMHMIFENIHQEKPKKAFIFNFFFHFLAPSRAKFYIQSSILHSKSPKLWSAAYNHMLKKNKKLKKTIFQDHLFPIVIKYHKKKDWNIVNGLQYQQLMLKVSKLKN